MDEILTIEDHQIIQNEAYENGFLLEIEENIQIDKQKLQNYYSQLINILNTLNNAIQVKKITITESTRSISNKTITMRDYTSTDKEIQQVFATAAKILYQLRTLITGEQIYLLENLDGDEKVISQEGWLSKITTNSGAVTLLESSIQQIENTHITSLQDSSIFNQLTKSLNIEKNLIEEAGSLYFDSPHKILVDEKKQLYRKTVRDIDVYAYWRTNAHNVYLLWNNQISYNYGELYETAINRAEQIASLNDTSIINQFKSILEGNQPLTAIFGTLNGVFEAYKKNSVPGLKEGDLKTATGDWVQVKRGNQQIVTFTQIYNNLKRVVNILSELQNDNSFTKDGQLKAKVVSRFANLYYSDKKIDQKIKNRLKQLPILDKIF